MNLNLPSIAEKASSISLLSLVLKFRKIFFFWLKEKLRNNSNKKKFTMPLDRAILNKAIRPID